MPSLDLCAPHLIKDAGKILREIEKLECEESLEDFTKAAWHVLEPAQPYVYGWAMGAVSEHLEAVTHGEIIRLLINVPPGFRKSLSTCVFWPAWEWGPMNLPHHRFLGSSYSEDYAVRDNSRMKMLVESEWYQERWPLPLIKAGERKFENAHHGWRQGVPFSRLTGGRGDRVIIDDPHSTEMAESPAERLRTSRIFLESVPTRLNNPSKSAIIVIMQRLHEEDISGVILSKELGYEHLCLPMEFEPQRRCVTSIGFVDPRTTEGELLFPERFPREVVERDKRTMGPYAVAGQFQQRPEPRGGGIFKREWWEIWPPADWPEHMIPKVGERVAYPEMEYVIASVDTAMTTKEENDWSACTIWGVWRDHKDAPKLMLMAAWQDKLEFSPLVEKIISTCRRWRVDRLLIEAKANGISVGQEIIRLCGEEEFGVTLNQVKGDKLARAYSVQHVFSSGLVFAPDKQWADMVLDQMATFPRSAHDDLVDSCVQAVKHLRDRGLAQFNDEREAELRSRFGPPGERKRLPYDV